MGGLMIIFATLAATLLWSELNNPYIWMMVLVTVGFGLIGFYDDYLKVIKKHNQGLSGRAKLVGQVIVALGPALWLYLNPSFSTTLTVPFFKHLQPDLGRFFVLFAVFVIVGTANAVNLTDGLDGLAIGPVTIAAGFYMIFCYLAGNVKIAAYLQIPYIRGVGELSIYLGALVGAGVGFLWFNAYPAQVFMGDVGALALGGALGTVALATKQESAGGPGHGAQDAAQGQGPHVPHEDLGRVGVEPEETHPGAHQGPQKDGELPTPRT